MQAAADARIHQATSPCTRLVLCLASVCLMFFTLAHHNLVFGDPANGSLLDAQRAHTIPDFEDQEDSITVLNVVIPLATAWCCPQPCDPCRLPRSLSASPEVPPPEIQF